MRDTDHCNTNGAGPDPAINLYRTCSKVLTSADGTRIYAEAVGRAPGPGIPTIVFIHGLLITSIVFDAIFTDDAWTHNAYLVRYDMRGQGRSGQPRDGAGWESERFAEDFDAVVNAFKLDKPFVAVGNHPAAIITDILSFRPPEYLSGIIYITPVPYTGPIAQEIASPAALDSIARMSKPASLPDFQSAVQTFVSLSSGINHTFPFGLYQMCLGNAIVQPVEAIGRLMSRTQDETGLLRAGREGRLRLLFLYGTQDVATGHGPVFDAIAGWVRLDTRAMKTGHTPWLEEPSEFRETILQWIRKASL
ncbi:Alpha/Beta hydrolase protein [Infundibulicybe gibba]|nr:Alpha/Beta hydrolase protein [Infundibulicybe gibba]